MIKPLALLHAALLCASLAQAGTMEVQFLQPDRYTDVGARRDAAAVQATLRGILQVLAAGLSASRVEPNRRPASGMVLSQEKRRTACISPILLRETGRWAGGTHDEYGGWTFSPEAWDKFTTSLSEDPPLELMTSPGVSAPESVLHPSCITRGCQEALVCPQGKCAKGRGQEAGR